MCAQMVYCLFGKLAFGLKMLCMLEKWVRQLTRPRKMAVEELLGNYATVKLVSSSLLYSKSNFRMYNYQQLLKIFYSYKEVVIRIHQLRTRNIGKGWLNVSWLQLQHVDLWNCHQPMFSILISEEFKKWLTENLKQLLIEKILLSSIHWLTIIYETELYRT